MTITYIDCTLRDGGYYNNWDFSEELVNDYLKAMGEIQVDFVEIGFRSLDSKGFKGATAYSSDAWIATLERPSGVKLGVMINASEIVGERASIEEKIRILFPETSRMHIDLVRFACHAHEFKDALIAGGILKKMGYIVGVNIMQIADRTVDEISELCSNATAECIDILYFADSMGGLTPSDTKKIVKAIEKEWTGPIGIHTHDNMGLALSNTKAGIEAGVTWVDSTVTGMGRGPGNVKTELVAIELMAAEGRINGLLKLINQQFGPMQAKYGWGANAYYYLSGKYGIHPTYVQEMLVDERFQSEDILAVLDQLKSSKGKKFSHSEIVNGPVYYREQSKGVWVAAEKFSGREVLIIGTGNGATKYAKQIEAYVRGAKPLVIALNTGCPIPEDLIDIRAACHPIRLMADSAFYAEHTTPLMAPVSDMTGELRDKVLSANVLDFGMRVGDCFEFGASSCVTPNSLVICYALAAANSGGAKAIHLVGFDGYPHGDSRNDEMDQVISHYSSNPQSLPLDSFTPTIYKLKETSIYAQTK